VSLLFRKYRCVKQHEFKDCGAACLATICMHYGKTMPISQIRVISGTDQNGTSVYGLIQAACKLGFTAKGIKGNLTMLFEQFTLPAIAHVRIDQHLHHFVVVHKVTKSMVIVADPAQGIRKIRLSEFLEIWTNVLIVLTPSHVFQPGDTHEHAVHYFFTLLRPHFKMICYIFFASCLFTGLGILSAFYFRIMIDEIIPYRIESTLHLLSFGMIFILFSRVLLQAFRNQCLLILSQKLHLNLLLNFYMHVIQLPMDFFTTRKSGEIISRIQDVSKIRETISDIALTLMMDALMIILGSFILYMHHPVLFGILVCFVPFYIGIVCGFHNIYEQKNRTMMEKNEQFTSYMVESMKGMETIKSLTAEHQVAFHTETKCVSLLKSVFQLGLTQQFQTSLKYLIHGLAGIVILWIGAFYVIQEQWTLGQFMTFNALIVYFLDPIQNLVQLHPKMQTATVALHRLRDVLVLEHEKSSQKNHDYHQHSLKGPIEIHQMDFRFGFRHFVLKQINLQIEYGEKVAFVGESGSGKSTLVQCLMHFYPIEKGHICINGYRIADIPLEELRSKMAYLPQEHFFFSGTIRDNLCLGLVKPVDETSMIEAAKMAQADDFIHQLPRRYESLIEENASNLSGGQKQRLALARAFLKKPEILILDEFTSQLDATTEKAISDLIFQLKDTTVIMIAHRLHTVMHCDQIFVMDQGEIIEAGNHHELIASNGKYTELWKNQWPLSVLPNLFVERP
jgi:ABC-type bacteriocin transporter